MGEVRPFPFPTNADHIKPRRPAMQTVARQVVERGFGDLPLLTRSDGLQRIPKGLASMRAHLHEDDREVIEGNEVYFTERRAVISGNDRIALGTQKLLGFTLSVLPKVTSSLADTHISRVTESAPNDQGQGGAQPRLAPLFR